MARFGSKLKKGNSRKRDQDKKKNGWTFEKRHGIFVIIALIAILASGGAYYIIKHSSYFMISDVRFSERRTPSTINYRSIEDELLGCNIFAVDIAELSGRLADKYPELKGLTVVRKLPDRVVFGMLYRIPVAQVKGNDFYLVDDEGVILPGATEDPRDDFPVINGVSARLSSLVGKRCKSRRLSQALLLLKEIRDAGLLEEHLLFELNVANTRNISFYLEDGLEIKIGGEDFGARLDRLVQLLSDPKIKPSEIRYIDLRFKNPVVNPRWIR